MMFKRFTSPNATVPVSVKCVIGGECSDGVLSLFTIKTRV